MPTRSQQSDVLAAAYASHGDTKQVLLFPATPRECFDMTVDAFDLADRLQTPVIMMAGALVLPVGIVGKIDASATLSPSIPCTRRRASTTDVAASAPIRQVPH